MDYSRMIHDYLDGELDQMQQDILFSELATNQDLRTDFNQQVKLQVVAQSDMALITPPLEATNAIFSSLGFSIPTEEYMKNLTGDTVATSPFSSFKRFWTKRIALNTVLLLILLTSGTMLVVNPGIFNSGQNNGKSSTVRIQKADNTEQIKLAGNASIPVVSSFADNSNNGNPAQNNNAININNGSNSVQGRVNRRTNAFNYNNESNSANSNVSGSNTDLAINQNITKQKLYSDAELISDASTDNNLTNLAYSRVNSGLSLSSNVYLNPTQSRDNSNFNVFNFYDFTNNQVSPFSPIYVDNTRWVIQARKLSLNPIEKIDLSQSFDSGQLNSWNTNMSFSALYKFNTLHALGLEIGWEAFNQVFLVNVDGQTKRQRQSPQLFWYGASYRFTAPEFLWENVIYPYGQITAGGTSVGPLFRAQTGLIIEPTNMFRFNVGFESAGIIYKVQNLTYGSGKYGLTFGGSINF